MSLVEAERAHARAAVVDEHIRCENSHDLDALMATFGMNIRYDDEPWEDHRIAAMECAHITPSSCSRYRTWPLR